MRLAHEKLIPELPPQQLLELHQNCCLLRGHERNNQDPIVNYVFQYSPYKLYQYHQKIIEKIRQLGYDYDPRWENPYYRGKECPPFKSEELKIEPKTSPIFSEHNVYYMRDCLRYLASNNIRLSFMNHQVE